MRQELRVLMKKPHWVYFKRIGVRKRKNKNGERVEEVVYGQQDSRRAIGIIFVDLRRRANPARTYLHELIHHYFGSSWAETQVIQYERELWNKLTQEERFNVYAHLFRRRFRGDRDVPP